MAGSGNSSSTELLLAACAATLTEHQVGPGQRLTVALSGGIDSVVLLHLLSRQAPGRSAQIAAVHVHHGLSPHADYWAEFCGQLCDQLRIPLTVERVSVERHSPDGLEAAARRARHAVFARLPGDFIALGHHRGDQAETVLFNLIRGTGLAGVAAMRTRRGRLLRPLLNVSRARIEDYARAEGLAWIDDESNHDTAFARNYLRHEVLAPLRQRFPGSENNLAAAAARFAEALDLLDDLARVDLAGSAEFPIPLHRLQLLSEPRQRNVVRYLLARHGVKVPSEARLHEAVRQFITAAPDRHPRISFGEWVLVRRAGQVELEKCG